MPGRWSPTDEEVAAALAAIQVYLQKQGENPGVEPLGWRESARLATQSLRPMRLNVRPSWGVVERLKRQSSGGFYGVTGL